MTRKEAIQMCMEIKDYLTQGNPIWDKDKVGEAIDMVIEALIPSADRPRPIDPTITVDLESGVVPRSAIEKRPRSPNREEEAGRTRTVGAR